MAISLLDKLRLFKQYKKTIKLKKSELETTFGCRIDKAWRIYYVINIPNDYVGEPYNLRKSDIDKIAETQIREYTIGIAMFLDSIGLKELYDFYEIKKVEKYSYLVVIGYSPIGTGFRTNKYYDFLRKLYIGVGVAFVITAFILAILKLFVI